MFGRNGSVIGKSLKITGSILRKVRSRSMVTSKAMCTARHYSFPRQHRSMAVWKLIAWL
jgi:hypothetical protein